MTLRIALALTLSFASACAVHGEEDVALEEIEASCSSKPGSQEPGELETVTLSRDGRKISIESLSREERELLVDTLDFIEASGYSGDTGCEFRTYGWTCEGDEWVCSCSHLSSGPKCDCHDAC
jgi:hypothetical protein